MITAKDVVVKKEKPYNSILPYLRAKQVKSDAEKVKNEKLAEKEEVEKND